MYLWSVENSWPLYTDSGLLARSLLQALEQWLPVIDGLHIGQLVEIEVLQHAAAPKPPVGTGLVQCFAGESNNRWDELIHHCISP